MNSYFDFASLAQLKGRDAVKQQENSKAVLEKFEALFIDQMLQSMRKATVRSELFDSEGIIIIGFIDLMKKSKSLCPNIYVSLLFNLADIKVATISPR